MKKILQGALAGSQNFIQIFTFLLPYTFANYHKSQTVPRGFDPMEKVQLLF